MTCWLRDKELRCRREDVDEEVSSPSRNNHLLVIRGGAPRVLLVEDN
jgi:hypothetical protein